MAGRSGTLPAVGCGGRCGVDGGVRECCGCPMSVALVEAFTAVCGIAHGIGGVDRRADGGAVEGFFAGLGLRDDFVGAAREVLRRCGVELARDRCGSGVGRVVGRCETLVASNLLGFASKASEAQNHAVEEQLFDKCGTQGVSASSLSEAESRSGGETGDGRLVSGGVVLAAGVVAVERHDASSEGNEVTLEKTSDVGVAAERSGRTRDSGGCTSVSVGGADVKRTRRRPGRNARRRKAARERVSRGVGFFAGCTDKVKEELVSTRARMLVAENILKEKKALQAAKDVESGEGPRFDMLAKRLRQAKLVNGQNLLGGVASQVETVFSESLASLSGLASSASGESVSADSSVSQAGSKRMAEYKARLQEIYERYSECDAYYPETKAMEYEALELEFADVLLSPVEAAISRLEQQVRIALSSARLTTKERVDVLNMAGIKPGSMFEAY